MGDQSLTDKLALLARLRHEGKLSEEQFEAAKRDVLSTASSQPVHPSRIAPTEKSGGNLMGCLVTLGIIALVVTMCSIGSTNHKAEIHELVAGPTVPAWTPPEGYTLAYTDNRVPFGFRWLKSKEFSCEYEERCWGAEVVTSKACPNTFYAQISLLDKAGTNIGWTNDTVQSLAAGQKAKLIFGSYEGGARSAELGQTSCY